MPRRGTNDDFGTVVPLETTGVAPRQAEKQSEAGAAIEFMGVTAHFPSSNPNDVAGLPLVAGRREKLGKIIDGFPRARSASVASMHKLAGKLRFAPTAALGRFASVVLKTLYHLLVGGGGKRPRRVLGSLGWRSTALRGDSPGLIWGVDPLPPVRVYSDSTGSGAVASFTFTDNGEGALPGLLTG